MRMLDQLGLTWGVLERCNVDRKYPVPLAKVLTGNKAQNRDTPGSLSSSSRLLMLHKEKTDREDRLHERKGCAERATPKATWNNPCTMLEEAL